MNHDYDDTIAQFEQEYEQGEYADLDADPEAEARARAREEQERLDKDRKRAQASRRLSEAGFTPGGLPALRNDGRTVADLELEGFAQATGHRAEGVDAPAAGTSEREDMPRQVRMDVQMALLRQGIDPVVSVDADCQISYSDGRSGPCKERPVGTFSECGPGYGPGGNCPKWEYLHRAEDEIIDGLGGD